jgi:hypothetical protein
MESGKSASSGQWKSVQMLLHKDQLGTEKPFSQQELYARLGSIKVWVRASASGPVERRCGCAKIRCMASAVIDVEEASLGEGTVTTVDMYNPERNKFIQVPRPDDLSPEHRLEAAQNMGRYFGWGVAQGVH